MQYKLKSAKIFSVGCIIKLNNKIIVIKGIDIIKAMDIYYSSRLAEQIAGDRYGIENMDAKYLAEDLIENELALLR